jgi:tetratricopeptide (TPR) repeat protein
MEHAMQQAVETGHIANQARVEHVLGYVHHYRGNLGASIQHYDRARVLYKQAGNQDRVATVDMNQGENYRFKGDFSRALRLYRSAYRTAEVLGDLRLQTMAAANEGIVQVAMSQYISARRALDAASQLASQWTEDANGDLPALLCEIHDALAVIDLREDRVQEAWEHALYALEIAMEAKKPMQLGFANRTVGEVVTRLGTAPDPRFSSDPDHYFRAAIKHFRELNAEAELGRTMYAQALSLAQRGRRTTAARKLQQVMILFTKLDMVDDAARAAEAQLAVL